jgi:DNA-binding NarL/FixJ family response regulator
MGGPSGAHKKGCRLVMIRIMLADDHAPYRAYLKALLEQQPGFAVVAQVADGQAAIDLLGRWQDGRPPDVLVMDVDMPGVGGVQATRAIVAACPGLGVIGLSLHDDPHLAAAMLGAGARGYIVKDEPLPALVHAIHEVAAGRRCLSRAIGR